MCSRTSAPFEEYANKLLTQGRVAEGLRCLREHYHRRFTKRANQRFWASPIVRSVAVFQYLRGVLDAIIEQTDIDAVALRVGELLDESLVVDRLTASGTAKHEFRITQSGKTWDLSKIDFDKLKEDFKARTYKNIEIADLRAFIQKKLEQMLKAERNVAPISPRGLQGIIDRYNAGSSSADNYFDELMKFTKDLKAESERHIREGLDAKMNWSCST